MNLYILYYFIFIFNQRKAKFFFIFKIFWDILVFEDEKHIFYKQSYNKTKFLAKKLKNLIRNLQIKTKLINFFIILKEKKIKPKKKV